MATCGGPAMIPEHLSHLAWDGLLHPHLTGKENQGLGSHSARGHLRVVPGAFREPCGDPSQCLLHPELLSWTHGPGSGKGLGQGHPCPSPGASPALWSRAPARSCPSDESGLFNEATGRKHGQEGAGGSRALCPAAQVARVVPAFCPHVSSPSLCFAEGESRLCLPRVPGSLT